MTIPTQAVRGMAERLLAVQTVKQTLDGAGAGAIEGDAAAMLLALVEERDNIDTELTAMCANYDAAQNMNKQLRQERDELAEALMFYADPETYHACGFMFDRPTGGFDEDFSDDHGHEYYDRPMPGKRARAALAKLG